MNTQPNQTKFVAYYRVSTTAQGESGLGLEAQQMAVEGYLATRPGADILAEFTEVESGKRKDRPELAEAVKLCRRHKATLIIAKLDRLARNVHFISGLMESRVDFLACDNPHANRLMVHMLGPSAYWYQKSHRIEARRFVLKMLFHVRNHVNFQNEV